MDRRVQLHLQETWAKDVYMQVRRASKDGNAEAMELLVVFHELEMMPARGADHLPRGGIRAGG